MTFTSVTSQPDNHSSTLSGKKSMIKQKSITPVAASVILLTELETKTSPKQRVGPRVNIGGTRVGLLVLLQLRSKFIAL